MLSGAALTARIDIGLVEREPVTQVVGHILVTERTLRCIAQNGLGSIIARHNDKALAIGVIEYIIGCLGLRCSATLHTLPLTDRLHDSRTVELIGNHFGPAPVDGTSTGDECCHQCEESNKFSHY